jgi:class 3 adenylate cyclase
VQIGIHCGAAIAGIIGHIRMQYDLVGDAVNTAARMCSVSQVCCAVLCCAMR